MKTGAPGLAAAAISCTMVLVAAPPTAAQTAGAPAPATVAAVEAAADRGDLAAARGGLARLLAAGERPAEPAARARLEFLRGRLSENVDSAEVAYLRAAIDGEGPYAGRARLRVAQLALARGDAARAAEHLARLRADDPDGELIPVSWVWSARAAEAAGDVAAACEAWAEALRGLDAAHAARPEAAQGRSRCEEGAPQPGEVETFTVQLGAFGSEEAALRLRDGAAGIGVAVRVESPSGGVHVYRVRAGRFGARADAERLADRFRAHGFEAVAVPEEP